jgi:hypothetical protein
MNGGLMLKKNLTIVIALVLIIGVGAVMALDKARPSKYSDQAPQLVFHVNETLSHLKHHIDLWHDANLKSDPDKISLYEGVLNDIISSDIAYSKKTVRSFAQIAVLESMSESREEDRAELAKNPLRSSQQFKSLVNNLNSKKKLAEAIRKSKAFSNKYRLLGDYLYLLQQELKIVKVELANEESDETEPKK